MLMTWPVVIVMALPERLRPVLKWEVRLLVHQMALVAYLALAWHSPKCAYYYLLALLVFILDKLGTTLFFQHKNEAATITNVGYGTVLSFDTPTSWKMADGYIRVCLPWIARTQWHPFSFYPVRSFDLLALPVPAFGSAACRIMNTRARATSSFKLWVIGLRH